MSNETDGKVTLYNKQHRVPFSELAMSMKIAGNPIKSFKISETGRAVEIEVLMEKTNETLKTSGLISELLPHELRREK